jgi:hypothetical protein
MGGTEIWALPSLSLYKWPQYKGTVSQAARVHDFSLLVPSIHHRFGAHRPIFPAMDSQQPFTPMHAAKTDTHRFPAMVYWDGVACDAIWGIATAAGSKLVVEAMRGPRMLGADAAMGVVAGYSSARQI